MTTKISLLSYRPTDKHWYATTACVSERFYCASDCILCNIWVAYPFSSWGGLRYTFCLCLSTHLLRPFTHLTYVSYVQGPLKKNQFTVWFLHLSLKQFFLTFNFYLGYFNLLFFFLTGCNIDIYIPSRMHFLVEINNFGCGASPLFTQYHYIENHT